MSSSPRSHDDGTLALDEWIAMHTSFDDVTSDAFSGRWRGCRRVLRLLATSPFGAVGDLEVVLVYSASANRVGDSPAPRVRRAVNPARSWRRRTTRVRSLGGDQLGRSIREYGADITIGDAECYPNAKNPHMQGQRGRSGRPPEPTFTDAVRNSPIPSTHGGRRGERPPVVGGDESEFLESLLHGGTLNTAENGFDFLPRCIGAEFEDLCCPNLSIEPPGRCVHRATPAQQRRHATVCTMSQVRSAFPSM